MGKFVIEGGQPLKGKVKASGAKNAVLKLMAASLLSDTPCFISNVPKIRDVFTMVEVLRWMGAEVDFDGDHRMFINPKVSKAEAPYDLVSQMRASIIVLGPLLAKYGKAKVAMPGGCNIGSRKIDLHLKGLESMGAEIEVKGGFFEAKTKGLRGTLVPLDFPSVGATENILMAAVLADGETVIENAAREPEIVDLANFLNKMGAQIKGAGGTSIKIKGVRRLKGVNYQVIPDRIEAGTFLIAAAITNGEVTVEGARSEHLELVISKLREAGAKISEKDNEVTVSLSKRPQAIDVAVLPFPGFPTDLQPQITVFLSLAEGISIVTENVFENRFLYVDELNRMGTDVRIEGHHAIIRGVSKLYGAPVKATDLRGGAALVLAGLAAEGETIVSDIYHIERGYENFKEKLEKLGARISIIE